MRPNQNLIMQIYHTMLEHFGPRGWWYGDEDISYQEMQRYLQSQVPPEHYIYNEYHALLVGVGAIYCKKNRPHCSKCPLLNLCKYLTYLQEKH